MSRRTLKSGQLSRAEHRRRAALLGPGPRRKPKPIPPPRPVPKARTSPKRPASGTGGPPRGPSPKPLRHTGGKADVFAPPDRDTLVYVYGRDKVRRVLWDYGMEKLKVVVSDLLRRHPKLTPPDRRKKAAVIDFIMRHWWD